MPEESPCKCIKWHSPRPTRYAELQVGEDVITLCPTTYTAVQDCVEDYKKKGRKPANKDLTKYPKYARDLAAQIWNSAADDKPQDEIQYPPDDRMPGVS